ncbi:MAG TPA: hypothetical protein PLN25_08285 [Deltaproteobacteria bacterium]|nr:hypothetical protein [Deltaproteobacteria bacterium]HQB39025.1 hypothetical protein [Deltaproteobacteria bacterium]
MSIAQLSPTIVTANPSYINPTARAESNAYNVQQQQSAIGSVQGGKTDTVTLSSEALQMSARANGQLDESRQNGPDKDLSKGR